jgi:phosphoglycolate phosphatase
MERAKSRALIAFDFDGTLADTWRDIAAALNETLDAEGFPAVSGPAVRFAIGEGVLPLLRNTVPGLAHDPDRLHALYMRFRDHYERRCLVTTELYAGIENCLARFAEADLAIVSNKPDRFLQPMVRALGLAARFAVVVGGDTLRVQKPDPEVWRHMRERFDGPHDATWMVGDSAIDVATGRAAGAQTIGCAWGLRGEEELRQAGADYIVHAPEEIADLVLEPEG